MTLTIYGGRLSPFVARTTLAARAKGIKYKLVAPEGGTKTPEFLKLNPFGKVPTLKDGKTVVFESSVIVEYLEAKSRAKRLVPASAKAGAAARLIAAIAAEYVQTAVGKLVLHLREPPADRAVLDAPAQKLQDNLDILEKALVRGKYAAGSRFTIADVYVAPTIRFAGLVAKRLGLSDVVAGRPKLKKYMAAMQKDKVAGEILAGMNEEWIKYFGA